jgi:hypothetical protein
VAILVSRMRLPLPLLGASKMRPLRASDSVRRTWSIPASGFCNFQEHAEGYRPVLDIRRSRSHTVRWRGDTRCSNSDCQ